MAEKLIKTRVQMKRGTQADWATAEAAGFKPLEGESIFYTDLNKIKVGKKDANGNLIPLSQLSFLSVDTASLISHGTSDPSENTVSQYYFKYN